MLQALLHGKLTAPGTDEEGAETGLGADVGGREDPLTASVFERLSYLPLPFTWALLARAVVPRTEHRWPATPAEEPSWSFWPSLRPGEGGHNTVRVEPDVVLRCGDLVVLFEAKHRGAQCAWQWREQVLAARRRWPGVRVIVVATGGWAPAADLGRVQELRAILPDPTPPVFRMTWEALRAAVDAESRAAAPAHTRSALLDIRQALTFWGYRPHQSLVSLVDYHRQTRGGRPARADALQVWSLRGPAMGAPSAGGFGSLTDVARLYDLAATPDLSTWSVK